MSTDHQVLPQGNRVSVVTDDDSPMCTCCGTPQPLYQDGSVWVCPVTQIRYSFDPALGTVERIASVPEVTPAGVAGKRPLQDLYPGNQDHAIHGIDPRQDGFA